MVLSFFPAQQETSSSYGIIVLALNWRTTRLRLPGRKLARRRD